MGPLDDKAGTHRPGLEKGWAQHAGYGALAWTVWLLSHPYQGIWHDARIYLVLALNRLLPDAFVRDVWFAFGSQGDLTLFDEAYAALLRVLPPSEAAKAVAMAGGAVWLAGCLVLGARMLGWRCAAAYASLLAILNPSYDLGANLLFVNESFATARPYAMGLVLAGMAAWIGGHRAAAGLLFAAALTLHPLMAIGGIACILVLALRDRVVLGLLLLTIAALAYGAWAGVPLLERMDPLWESLVRHTSAIVLPLEASAVGLDRNLWPIALLLLAGRLGAARHRRLYHAVAFVAVWCLLVALVVGLYYPAVLLAQAQVWRVSWLATVVALLAALDIIVTRPIPQRRAASFGLTVSYLAAGSGLGSALLLAGYATLVAPGALTIVNAVWQTHCSERTRRLIIAAIVVWASVLAYFRFSGNLPTEIEWPLLGVKLEAPSFIAHKLLPALVFLGVWTLTPRIRVVSAWFLLGMALILWDQRTSATRTLEAGYLHDDQALLQALGIRRGDVVYWAGNDLGPWFTLVTAGYAQSVQGIGIVFARPHALTLYTRLRAIGDLSEGRNDTGSGEWSPFDLHAPTYHPSSLSGHGIGTLCADSALDHIIQHRAADGLPAHTIVRRRSHLAALHVYHCARLRAQNQWPNLTSPD